MRRRVVCECFDTFHTKKGPGGSGTTGRSAERLPFLVAVPRGDISACTVCVSPVSVRIMYVCVTECRVCVCVCVCVCVRAACSAVRVAISRVASTLALRRHQRPGKATKTQSVTINHKVTFED